METYRLPLLTAGEIMNANVLTLAPDMPVGDAVSVLLQHGYSGAPVVDKSAKLVGVFSENDCLQALSSAAFYVTPSGTVADHMTREVQTVERGTDLLRLTYMLHEGRIRRLPVVEKGRVIGLITRRDVLAALDRVRVEREKELHRPVTKLDKVEAKRRR